MAEITSYEIGDLFEKASLQMLQILFEAWGYRTETLETRRQKSGTQHGFDIYLKVYDNSFLPIHIFIECKGSKDIGTIDKYELAIKSDQLKRVAFAVKDIQLFFSPTLSINYKNDEPPVEEDDNPFCVVDMMKPKDKVGDVFNLFISYSGNNRDIINYRDKILLPLRPNDFISENFDSIAARLKIILQTRLQAYLSLPKQKGFSLLTPSFWNYQKSISQPARLPDYYIRLDSVKKRLLDVVANDFHISIKRTKYWLLQELTELQNKNGGLIKILSNGGEGKSTFLLDIGKELCKAYTVFFIQSWNDDTLAIIKKQLSLLQTNLIPVILLDDAAHFEEELDNYGEEIANWPGGIVMILAERYYRYQRMQIRENFENLFQNAPVQLNFQSKVNTLEIFERFFDQLKVRFTNLTAEDYEISKEQFLKQGKHTVAEKIFGVLRMLHQNNRIVFPFDWDEWKDVHKDSPLKHLYLLVSAFYQFGNSITIEFCTKFNALLNISTLDIRNAIDNSINQPISRNGEFLQLRHEKVAEWFIEDEQQQENVRSLYEEWLTKIDTTFSKNLLLWTYRNYDFTTCDYLKGIVSSEATLKLLKTFIDSNPEELAARTESAKILKWMKKPEEAIKLLLEIINIDKNNLHARTELSKIYQQQKKWKEAEDILLELLALDKENLQARTELSKIYQQQKKWKEAEDILKELLALDKENLHPRTELSKIYQQQKKWDEAIKYLKEYIELDPGGLHPRTELSKIYQQQKKWKEAEDILKEEIQIAPDALHPRTELSKIYQQQKKWDEAIKYLKEYIELDPGGLHPRTELSKIYQQQKKWKEAEDILLELLALDKENLQARTELSKIYQQQKKWKEAEDILLESLVIDTEQLHPRTELSKIYQQQKKWKEAEDILKEEIQIAPDALHPRTELSKIYQQQKKWDEAIKYLKEYIELDPGGLHPRTELSKIYQQQKKWKEAEDILLELLALDKENLQARTELSKIYQQQKKWKEAEDILLELLALDKENLQARTELSKIYQQQKKWKEAEDILLELLALDKENLQARTELSKIYQQQKKWKEAEDILLESLVIDTEQLHPRTELSKIYQQQKKWKEAEDILKELFVLDKENFRALTEMALLYKKWMKDTPSGDVQKKALNIKYLEAVLLSYKTNFNNISILMELADIFTKNSQYRAGVAFLEIIQTHNRFDLGCITALERIYGYMNASVKIQEVRQAGAEVIIQNPNVKFRDWFEKMNTQIKTDRSLISLTEKGVFQLSQPDKFILTSEGKTIPLIQVANLFKHLKPGDPVFYATYLQNGVEFADCIEPIFYSVDDLTVNGKKLKDLFDPIH